MWLRLPFEHMFFLFGRTPNMTGVFVCIPYVNPFWQVVNMTSCSEDTNATIGQRYVGKESALGHYVALLEFMSLLSTVHLIPLSKPF